MTSEDPIDDGPGFVASYDDSEPEVFHNWGPDPEVGWWKCRCGARRLGPRGDPPNNIVICVEGFAPPIPVQNIAPMTRFMEKSVITPEQFIRALRRDLFEAVGNRDQWSATEFGVLISRITHLLRDPDEMVRLEVASKLAWPDGAW